MAGRPRAVVADGRRVRQLLHEQRHLGRDRRPTGL
jgi:hypothetical protein